MKTWVIDDEAGMVALGENLGRVMSRQNQAVTVFLNGPLGAGKTTLARGMLRAFGYFGAVKSPTYTLVEAYDFDGRNVYHFDLYRLHDPEELEYMGIRDYFLPGNICLVEWPERGDGILPEPDWTMAVSVDGAGRRITLVGQSPLGDQLLHDIGDQ